jgi:hypothetical protein
MKCETCGKELKLLGELNAEERSLYSDVVTRYNVAKHNTDLSLLPKSIMLAKEELEVYIKIVLDNFVTASQELENITTNLMRNYQFGEGTVIIFNKQTWEYEFYQHLDGSHKEDM